MVEILLNDDIAAACERSVFLSHEHGIDRRVAPRILRAVDETQQIAVVKITEALHFVYRRDSISQTRHDLHRKFEAQIHALRADVKQQVSGRRNRMARPAANLAERMKLCWSRRPKQPIPRIGPKTHDAGKARFQVAKFYCTHQRLEVSAERTQSRGIVEARV